MPITVNIRHLEAHNVQLEGALAAKELDIERPDEVIRVTHPLEYKLEVQQIENGLLVQGRLHLPLDCECVRCLKPFRYDLVLDPWTSLLSFTGEEAVTINNDVVDLTPYVREDILLEFPQHPLCQPECRGLPKPSAEKKKRADAAGQTETGSSTWSELNKLKF